MDYSDLALLMLRGWVGLVMLVHGANHARTLEGTGRWLGRVGWRAPRFQAWLLSVIEIAIGLGMILGLMTTPAAAGAVAIMLVAFLTEHLRNGFFIFNKGQGYEYVITLAVAGASVALIGAGGWSLDLALGVDLSSANRAQVLLAVIGLSAVHLAASWRPARIATRGG
ncbi:MAG: DoxX family protein [bacterium]|nr:DoxX family protein [bacterium]MDE0290466.1 DoxX family protein [bacterium]MDE0439345.1 DoxX family protein [bacterium]